MDNTSIIKRIRNFFSGFTCGISFKILIGVAMFLFLAGSARFLFLHFRPIDTMALSFMSLNTVKDIEEEIQIVFQTDESDYYDASENLLKTLLNNIFVSINYKKTKINNASSFDFVIGARYNQNILLSGTYYVDKDMVALYLPDAVGQPLYYYRDESNILPNINIPNSATTRYKNYLTISLKPYLKKDKNVFVTVRDRHYDNEYSMDNFSFAVEGQEFYELLRYYVQIIKADDEIWESLREAGGEVIDIEMLFATLLEFLEAIPEDKSMFNKLYIKYQVDDFLRLRGVHAELHFNWLAVLFDMNVISVNSGTTITPLDVSEGIDLKEVPQSEIEHVLNEIFKTIY